jgi:SNF2 family DNA or RNA helicase
MTIAKLEDIKPNCAVRGILPSGVVSVVSVQWFGLDAIELTYKDATGRVGNELLYRDRESDLEIVQEGRPGASTAMPHQITAVYESMLPRQPLRFLLADDPGAGKTIMAGLLIRELIARGDLQRCLVVCPGSLAEQWKTSFTGASMCRSTF